MHESYDIEHERIVGQRLSELAYESMEKFRRKCRRKYMAKRDCYAYIDFSKVVSDCHEEVVRLSYDPSLPMSEVTWYCTTCGCQCRAVIITDRNAYHEQCDNEVFRD